MSTSNSIFLCGVHNFSVERDFKWTARGTNYTACPHLLNQSEIKFGEICKGHWERIWLIYASFAGVVGKWNFVGSETNFRAAGKVLFPSDLSYNWTESGCAFESERNTFQNEFLHFTVTFERTLNEVRSHWSTLNQRVIHSFLVAWCKLGTKQNDYKLIPSPMSLWMTCAPLQITF